MKYFKITKTWAVKAESEAEAVKLVTADPETYLDAETVTRTEYKKRQPNTGWGSAVKDQLLGVNSKRSLFCRPFITARGEREQGSYP
jgi:hypothetical protein